MGTGNTEDIDSTDKMEVVDDGDGGDGDNRNKNKTEIEKQDIEDINHENECKDNKKGDNVINNTQNVNDNDNGLDEDTEQKDVEKDMNQNDGVNVSNVIPTIKEKNDISTIKETNDSDCDCIIIGYTPSKSKSPKILKPDLKPNAGDVDKEECKQIINKTDASKEIEAVIP